MSYKKPTGANRLKQLREAKGLSGMELASILGVHVQTIHRYESGIGGIPDSKKAWFAEFFNVSIAYLMGWDDDNGNDENGEPAVGEVA